MKIRGKKDDLFSEKIRKKTSNRLRTEVINRHYAGKASEREDVKGMKLAREEFERMRDK